MASNKQANIATMKSLIANVKLQERAKMMLGNESGIFLASALDLFTSDSTLVNCDPNAVMQECLKAAALKLPIAKSLGFAYVIPYNNKPQFQLGFKGLIQLAQRSGQYKYINADCTYEGEDIKYDRLTGMLTISGEKTSDKVKGYFAYFQLLNGYEKCYYMTVEQVRAHAKKYSKSYGKAGSPWVDNFDAMAIKTVLKALISKYGIMSIEMSATLDDDNRADDKTIETEIIEKANAEPLEITDEEVPLGEPPMEQPGAVQEPAEEPDF